MHDYKLKHLKKMSDSAIPIIRDIYKKKGGLSGRVIDQCPMDQHNKRPRKIDIQIKIFNVRSFLCSNNITQNIFQVLLSNTTNF